MTPLRSATARSATARSATARSTTARSTAAGLLLAATGLVAHAQPQGGPGSPPPEAVEACKGKTAGTQVSFTDRGGRSVTGPCAQVDGVLAVKPVGGPPPGGASAPRS